MALGKKLLIAIVAIVIIVIICIAAGIIVLNKDKDNKNENTTTYWYYINYSDDATSTGNWFTGTGNNASEALIHTLDASGIENSISGAWITSINGVEPSFDVDSKSWYTWVWDETGSEWTLGEGELGLEEPGATIFYLGVTTIDAIPPTFTPNLISDSLVGGPFAA
ncbi:hypothetical protein Mpt1_c02200 [Candidatus Methanoplasma termitum]|uniref:Uncharacterized protein n=1 Tax=Candidatus Methanoplasma termitum TaxID=1577791 RepID=A0A0A7LAH1_9ARCH|nr:hypothetical protein [Candidatus Methanoplasma termitum]AIZ56120.1 hypothetical protein Mpt1_c02200 [Candidatus Methanoplasma termitum]